jgi:hypothetical protein
MLYVKTEVRESEVHNLGLFLLEPVKKGTVILIANSNGIMTETEYQSEQAKDNMLISMTAVRLLGRHFIYGDSIGNEEYMNHSETPNMLYHCGICLAARDIAPGEELTVNYKYFLAEQDVFAFNNAETGQKVDGISPADAFIQSAEEVLALLKELLQADSESTELG